MIRRNPRSQLQSTRKNPHHDQLSHRKNQKWKPKPKQNLPANRSTRVSIIAKCSISVRRNARGGSFTITSMPSTRSRMRSTTPRGARVAFGARFIDSPIPSARTAKNGSPNWTACANRRCTKRRSTRYPRRRGTESKMPGLIWKSFLTARAL